MSKQRLNRSYAKVGHNHGTTKAKLCHSVSQAQIKESYDKSLAENRGFL